jgi:hypothetical protein
VRLRRILLKANGNRAAHSFRWNINWTYTFWRPSSPAMGLAATDVGGASATGSARGGSSGTGPAVSPATPLDASEGGERDGDRVVLDRDHRRLTIELNL